MNWREAIRTALRDDGICALITITQVEGSAPRNTDAWMVVSRSGTRGSIGGGALEFEATRQAMEMIVGGRQHQVRDQLLGPDLGQCCGGRVRIETQVLDRASPEQIGRLALAERQRRMIFLFGAGHVGRALVMALAALPFEVRWIDERQDAFPAVLPEAVTPVRVKDPMAELAKAPAGSFAYVMTHSHPRDQDIVDAALRKTEVAVVGLIGSETKKARFIKRFRESGITEAQLGKLICPIGLEGISGKEPAVIAASAVAQILILDEAQRQG